MRVKCKIEIPYFTIDKVYDVTHIDSDGDIWVEEDDDGHKMFLTPDECEIISPKCSHCNGRGFE